MLESELFALLQQTADAAFSVTEEGKIVSWNKAAERLLGYPASDALHKTCYEILEGMGPLGTSVCHQHSNVSDCVGGNTSEIPNFDMSVKTRAGERLWINMSTIVFDNQRTGRRLMIHLAHDVTAQKKNEEMMQKMLDVSKQISSMDEAPVRAEPVAQQGGALQGLAGNDFALGKNLLEVISTGNCSSRAGCGSHAAESVAWTHNLLQDLYHRVPGDIVMPQVVAELFELVEDHQVLPGCA